MQGGKTYGHHTLTRFFALHAGVLPVLLVTFLGLHVYVFRRHGITTPDPKAPPGTFWPEQVMKDAVACLGVLAVVLFFALWKGAELSAPADPAEEYPARPEWYFLFLFRFLKFEFIEQFGLAFGAIYIPGIAMTIIALMPFLGKTRAGHRFNVLFTLALLLGAVALTGVAMREDQHDAEFQAKLKFAERDAHRVVELAQREGIPPLGARELLANDAYTQGPRLFARHCASCHRFDGHDGTGVRIVKRDHHHSVDVPATAADLGKFGSRDWLRHVLVDYHETFQPIAGSVQPVEDSLPAAQRAALEDLNAKKQRFLTGDMAVWSESNKARLQEADNAQGYQALVEFLIAQSGREDQGSVDAELARQGRQVFETGRLASGSIDSCVDCHAMKLADGTELGSPGTGAPTLTGYAGRHWLTEFLKNPGHADFYGENNLMPGFANTLSDRELGLLVDWMIGEYYRGPQHGSHGH